MLETEENCGGRIEEIVRDQDRISALPDDLLVTILKYVPTKDAVATMILSKRWLFVWTMLPILIYKENNDDESKKSVWWFLDKSLQLHKAPVLKLLSMEVGKRCPTDADVGKWVENAVDRGVGLLELLWSAHPTSLPDKLYNCKSLQTLSLSDKILVDVPSTGTACLPSLTMLVLKCVVYKNDESLIRLLSSCPVLECLFVRRIKDDNVKKFTVNVPSLLELEYIHNLSDSDVEENGRCLVIDTPALEEFYFANYSGDSFSIENMPCFKKLYINVGWSFPDIDKFLGSFSAVSFLELQLTHKLIPCWTTIRFSRLTTCKIRPWVSDWMDSLVPFLQNTPKLKFLIVDYSTNQPSNPSALWSESSYEPECLSSSLEKFELIDYTGREEEQELVEYILTTSRCLKTATISLRSMPYFNLEDKETMMEDLKAIPRVSITSQILFKF